MVGALTVTVVTRAFAADCVTMLLNSPSLTIERTYPSRADDTRRTTFEVGGVRLAVQEHADGTPWYFEVVDRESDHGTDFQPFKIEARLFEGVLNFHVRTKTSEGLRSRTLRGRELFDRMMRHFGPRVKVIRAQWDYGDNLAAMEHARRGGATLDAAARATWTARQAARFGFTDVSIVVARGDPRLFFVVVEFTRSSR